MKSRVFAGALVVLVLTQLGCSSIPEKIEKPEVSVESVDVDRATLTDATVLVKLGVKNPNPFKLSMDSMSYELLLDGNPFAKGSTDEGASVAAKGKTDVVLPLRIKYWDLFSQFKNLMKKRQTHYDISGTITSWGHDIPFKHSGDFKLPDD
jgi:LEA14-like dessication related protein